MDSNNDVDSQADNTDSRDGNVNPHDGNPNSKDDNVDPEGIDGGNIVAGGNLLPCDHDMSVRVFSHRRSAVLTHFQRL